MGRSLRNGRLKNENFSVLKDNGIDCLLPAILAAAKIALPAAPGAALTTAL
jgi:hypothetical protein